MYEDVLGFFMKRRSIRAFTEKPVEKELRTQYNEQVVYWQMTQIGNIGQDRKT